MLNPVDLEKPLKLIASRNAGKLAHSGLREMAIPVFLKCKCLQRSARDPGFFLPVRVLSRLFRRLFFEALETAFSGGKLRLPPELEAIKGSSPFAQYLAPLRETEWVVYAKPPFGGPQQALDYLGRYTHAART